MFESISTIIGLASMSRSINAFILRSCNPHNFASSCHICWWSHRLYYISNNKVVLGFSVSGTYTHILSFASLKNDTMSFLYLLSTTPKGQITGQCCTCLWTHIMYNQCADMTSRITYCTKSSVEQIPAGFQPSWQLKIFDSSFNNWTYQFKALFVIVILEKCIVGNGNVVCLRYPL